MIFFKSSNFTLNLSFLVTCRLLTHLKSIKSSMKIWCVVVRHKQNNYNEVKEPIQQVTPMMLSAYLLNDSTGEK